MTSIFDNPYYRQYTTNPYESGYYQGKQPYTGLQTKGLSFQQQTPSTETAPSQEGAGGKMDWGGMIGNVGTGLAAGQGNDAEVDPYSIDPNAGYKGSFKGLSGGPIGAIVGGITSQVGTFSKVNKNLKALKPNISGYTVDENGSPTFNAGAFTSANQTLNELKEGQRKIKKSKDPATHVFDAAFGTRRKLNRKEDEMRMAILGEKQAFNAQNLQYQQQQLARRAYEDQISNVYGISNRYY
jgi:hypothetical protein